MPKLSALALNQASAIPMVRPKPVARQNYPFSKPTAGKVIERPVHLVRQIYTRCMAIQLLSTQDIALSDCTFA